MGILFRLSLILVALFITAVGIAHWQVIQQPTPNLEILANPDGSQCDHPCLFGIQPGFTSLDRASALLHGHHFTAQFAPNLEGDIYQQGSMQVITAWGL